MNFTGGQVDGRVMELAKKQREFKKVVSGEGITLSGAGRRGVTQQKATQLPFLGPGNIPGEKKEKKSRDNKAPQNQGGESGGKKKNANSFQKENGSMGKTTEPHPLPRVNSPGRGKEEETCKAQPGMIPREKLTDVHRKMVKRAIPRKSKRRKKHDITGWGDHEKSALSS